jgi:carboxyl-terminal processing protease
MRTTRTEFWGLFFFLFIGTMVLTNFFAARIFAEDEADVYKQVEPLGDAIYEINSGYYQKPAITDVVEGGIRGMMNSLDEHSSYIAPRAFEQMTDDTQGKFEGIGVSIQRTKDLQNILVHQPLPQSPAAKEGVMAGDIIYKIDDVDCKGMSLDDAAQLIKGPRGTTVKITVVRLYEDESRERQILNFDIKRDVIPLLSVEEARMVKDGVGYVRVSDFKQTTADELEDHLQELLDEGMTSLVLDLRWNPGGLLNSAKDVSELFLPKNTLVTYTRGRETRPDHFKDNVRLYTERKPVIPEQFPIVILTSRYTASSSEIVTAALQYWKRAIIVGEKSFGKGSVQTIIPLQKPRGAALRLTTALYYTPADVTINKTGILPDVDVKVTKAHHEQLLMQLRLSSLDDAQEGLIQNHGSVTGDEITEETVEDITLQRAVEILSESSVFQNLIASYHRDHRETQVAETAQADEALPKTDIKADAAVQ